MAQTPFVVVVVDVVVVVVVVVVVDVVVVVVVTVGVEGNLEGLHGILKACRLRSNLEEIMTAGGWKRKVGLMVSGYSNELDSHGLGLARSKSRGY